MAMAAKVPLGHTGETVRANIKRLREGQNLSYAELARRTGDVGRPIPVLGVRRIEAAERRVDVDDLMALAAALDVSPITLLVPYDSVSRTDLVEITGVEEPQTAVRVWEWMRADDSLVKSANGVAWLDFARLAFPLWRQRQALEGVEKLLELNRLEDEVEAGGAKAATARRRLDEITRAREYSVSDGDD